MGLDESLESHDDGEDRTEEPADTPSGKHKGNRLHKYGIALNFFYWLKTRQRYANVIGVVLSTCVTVPMALVI